jgi:hypothetical protein
MAKIDDFILSADKRYAPMWVAKFWIWVGATAGAIVIAGFIVMIAKTYLYINK